MNQILLTTNTIIGDMLIIVPAPPITKDNELYSASYCVCRLCNTKSLQRNIDILTKRCKCNTRVLIKKPVHPLFSYLTPEMILTEVWKHFPLDTNYLVSSLGRVMDKRLEGDTQFLSPHNKPQQTTEIDIEQELNSELYYTISYGVFSMCELVDMTFLQLQ